MKTIDLLTNKILRDEVINEERLEVLDKVKKLTKLGNSELCTVQMVSDYYEVSKETIQSLVKDHREELQSNGMKLYKRAEILNVLEGHLGNNIEHLEVPNRGMNLFNKRSILNVGMLLTESKVAEQVRTLLLDNHEQLNNIHKKLENGEEINQEDIDKTSVTYYIDKETELRNKEKELISKFSEAYFSGDEKLKEDISCQINKVKEDIIKLKNEEIDGMKPKSEYCDVILKCKDTVSITQISKDYGMSGQAMNKKLNELKVQYKQGKQWLLYNKYQNLGWTQSETYNKNDRAFITTKWTQKGRMGLYELLKENGILPVIERNKTA